MIRFKDILSEIKIQPSIYDDPIKAKGLKVGDKIEWISQKSGEKRQSIIISIIYHKFINDDDSYKVPSWKEADFVEVETYVFSLYYVKNPKTTGGKIDNKEFDTIKKIK